MPVRSGVTTAGRGRIAPALLFSLTAGLGVLLPAHAAAGSPRPATATGNAHSCDIEAGRAYCWGENDYGQLGDGSTVSSSMPVAVSTRGVLAGKTLTQISAGGGAGLDTCALDSAGAVYCWGSGFDGALGDGGTAGSAVPVAVDVHGVLHGQTVTQISAGADGACVLDSAGAAYCWGDNDYGELGDDTTADSSVPVAVAAGAIPAGQTLTQISSGYEDTCALSSAGAAYCWGDDFFGELGDNGGASAGYSSAPVAVYAGGALAGKRITQLSAGWLDACVLDSAGAAYCWGAGPITSSSGPVAVGTGGALTDRRLTQISAGLGETCALDSAGAAFCWGTNGAGELGDGKTADSAAPVAVDISGVLARKVLTGISAGGFHVCVGDRSGARYCWGDNNQGDLGNGTTAPSDVPVLSGPQAPAGVRAVPGDTTAAVSWAAPPSLDGGKLLGYTATASPGGASCTAANAARCLITRLVNGATYRIAVVAHTTAGDSGASTPVTVTPRRPA
jgi:alpha-tubulin suppressor-like RCC1 family protein